MNPMIQNVSFSNATPAPAPHTPASTAGSQNPVDAFAGSAEVTPADAMRALRSVQKVEKQGRSFSVSDRAVGPDGSLYVAYKDWKPDGPGYVSATRKDGGIAWEAPCDGVRALRVTPDGVLHAVTHSEHVRYSAQGAEIGREPLPAPLDKAWIAPDGTLVGVGKDQRLVGGPADALSEPVQSFEPTGNTLEVRGKGEWAELDGARVLQRRSVPANAQDGKIFTAIEDVYALPDGGTLLKTRETIEVRRPFPGGGFGHMSFGPMSEPDPGEYITRVHLRRVSPAGEKQWETDNLGDNVRVAVATDGTAYATVESGGQGRLLRFGAEGKREDVGPLSPPASGLTVEGDAVVASDGHGLSVLRDGSLQPVPNTKAWRVTEGLGDGRVFLTDFYNKTAAVLDVATLQVVSLTDPEGDHSSGRIDEIVKQAESSKPSAPPPTVIVEDEFVEIGGVRVERNKDR